MVFRSCELKLKLKLALELIPEPARKYSRSDSGSSSHIHKCLSSYFKTPGVGITDPITTGPTGTTGGANVGIGPVPSTV